MEIQDLFKVKCYFKVNRIHIFKIFLSLFIYLEISFPIFSEDSPIIPSEKIVVVEGKKEVKSKTDESFLSGANTEIKLSVPDVIPFVLARKNGDVFTAKCPAIIFQHYKDILFKLKQRFTEARDFVIIDWSDFSDHNKVVQGRTALTVMQKPQNHNLTIANIFFGDDEGHIAKMEYSAVSSIKADPMVV